MPSWRRAIRPLRSPQGGEDKLPLSKSAQTSLLLVASNRGITSGRWAEIMCGIFGECGGGPGLVRDVKRLTALARHRGADSSGFLFKGSSAYEIHRADFGI